jgi:hypothetical protein
MLDQGGKAFLLLTVEVGVFEEGEVAGTADFFHFTENAEGVEAQFVEFFAGGGWKHGRNYINFRTMGNGTLVLRAEEIRQDWSGVRGLNSRFLTRALGAGFGMTRLAEWQNLWRSRFVDRNGRRFVDPIARSPLVDLGGWACIMRRNGWR